MLVSVLPLQIVLPDIEEDNHIFESKCSTFHPNRNTIVKDRNIAKITSELRPELEMSQSSPSGRFLIHYSISGFNSVNLTDKNGNAVPDYIDSVAYYFDFVFNKQVFDYGYLAPASDKEKGGSSAFDVYVLNIGIGDVNYPGLYGYTITEDLIPGGNPNRPRHTAYIVIDNDYSSLDSSLTSSKKKYRTFYDTAYTALKITAAHEFHHAIQFMYGEDAQVPAFNELTSTWFEYALFPETRDYLQYVKVLFRNPEAYPFGKGGPTTGYLYGFFGQYLNKQFGPNVIKRCWEIIADGIQSYDALNSALQEKSTTLQDEWCKFLEWLYYTGEKAKPDFGFDSAGILPEVTFYKDELFQKPTYSNSAGLLSFEFRFFRMKFKSDNIDETPLVLDLLVSNYDLRAAIYQSDYEMPYVFSVTSNSMPDYTSIDNTGCYYRIDTPKGNICNTAKLSGGILTEAICYAYPNPAIENETSSIFFPAPFKGLIDDEVTIDIYDTGLRQMLSKKGEIIADGDKRVIKLDFSTFDSVDSGIYIFKVGDEDSCTGKIAIIRTK